MSKIVFGPIFAFSRNVKRVFAFDTWTMYIYGIASFPLNVPIIPRPITDMVHIRCIMLWRLMLLSNDTSILA